jgi:hypothetical protein
MGIRRAATVEGRSIAIEAGDPVPLLRELTNWAADEGLDLIGLEVRRPSLEDVYLRLTGEADGKEGDR